MSTKKEINTRIPEDYNLKHVLNIQCAQCRYQRDVSCEFVVDPWDLLASQ